MFKLFSLALSISEYIVAFALAPFGVSANSLNALYIAEFDNFQLVFFYCLPINLKICTFYINITNFGFTK